MKNHTQGEWRVSPVNTNGTDGFEIHYSDDGECITDHVYELVDAKLISAAPELLKFAKAFSKILANGEMDIHAKDGFNKDVADMIRLNIIALQKADIYYD